MYTYRLDLTAEQARAVSDACDLLGRVHLGQWGEIVRHLSTVPDDLARDGMTERMAAALDRLASEPGGIGAYVRARGVEGFLRDLGDATLGYGGSLGVRRAGISPAHWETKAAKRAYTVRRVIEHRLHHDRTPDRWGSVFADLTDARTPGEPWPLVTNLATSAQSPGEGFALAGTTLA